MPTPIRSPQLVPELDQFLSTWEGAARRFDWEISLPLQKHAPRAPDGLFMARKKASAERALGHSMDRKTLPPQSEGLIVAKWKQAAPEWKQLETIGNKTAILFPIVFIAFSSTRKA